MIKLDSRLKAVASLIDNYNILWDVGSDHGYLPLYLLENKKITYGILSDVNPLPLEKGLENALKYGLKDKISTHLCSGVSTNENFTYDAISICGMGGELITSILKEGKNNARKAKALILQPMNAISEVRKYLYNNDYTIVKEELVRDRHLFYNIIKCLPKKDLNSYDEIFFEISYDLFINKHPLFLEFINKKISIEEKILFSCKDKKSENSFLQEKKSKEKIFELKELIKKYED